MSNESFIVRCSACGSKNRIPVDKMGAKALCGKCRKPLVVGSGKDRSHPVEVSDMNFQDEIISHPGAVLVDFWAPWCGPCRSLAPVLEQLAQDYSDKIKIAKLNVDNNPKTASHYNIRSIPSMLLFRNGKLVDTVVGALPKTELMKHINAII